MTTITTDAIISCGHEVADRHYMEEEGSVGGSGLNRYGLRSHSPAPNDGRYGYHVEGIRSPIAGGGTSLSEFFLATEGYHIRTPSWVFKPNIPQGAIIDSAVFRATPKGAAPSTTAQGYRRFRLYGVKEPNYLPRQMDFSNVYDQSAKGRHWWQFRYSRRYRVDSFDDHKRHTDACCYWQWTDTFLNSSAVGDLVDMPGDGGTGSLAAVIQEIVGLPKWKAHNRLCLILALDKNIAGVVAPTSPGDTPTPNATGGTQGGYFDGIDPNPNMPLRTAVGSQYGGTTTWAKVPKLVVTYH